MPKSKKEIKKPPFSSTMKTPLNVVKQDVDGTLSIEVDLPGVISTEIDVSAVDIGVVLKGQRAGVPWQQTIDVDDKVYDPTSCQAYFKNGVLQLLFSRWLDSEPTKVVINEVVG